MKNDFIKNKHTYNQPKKAVKKTFSFYALVFALLFMFIGSILGSIAFVRTCDTDNSVNTAYADIVDVTYQYNGSNIYIPCSFYYINRVDNNYYIDYEINYYQFATISVEFDLLFNNAYVENSSSLNNVPIFRVDPDLSVGTSGTDGLVIYFIDTNNKLIRMTSDTFYYRTVTDSSYFGTYALCDYDSSGSEPTDAFYFSLVVDKGFSCNVQRFRLNTVVSSFGSDSNGDYVNSQNVLTYYDEANREFRFEFNANTYVSHNLNNPNGYGFLDRTYFLTSDSYSSGYSQAYIDELIARYDRQIADIERNFESEKENIREDAFQDGKNEGLAQAESGNFLSLFGALFDAPIRAVSGLLNFEVLGFNLWNFFTAVITIGIVIFVVRLFL